MSRWIRRGRERVRREPTRTPPTRRWRWPRRGRRPASSLTRPAGFQGGGGGFDAFLEGGLRGLGRHAHWGGRRLEGALGDARGRNTRGRRELVFERHVGRHIARVRRRERDAREPRARGGGKSASRAVSVRSQASVLSAEPRARALAAFLDGRARARGRECDEIRHCPVSLSSDGTFESPERPGADERQGRLSPTNERARCPEASDSRRDARSPRYDSSKVGGGGGGKRIIYKASSSFIFYLWFCMTKNLIRENFVIHFV